MLRVVALAALLACQEKPRPAVKDAGHTAPEPKATFQKLAPLHPEMPPAVEGDWRARFDEKQQTFEQFQYAAQRPRAGRDVLYVVRVGNATEAEDRIVSETVRLLEPFFSVKVKELERVPASEIPERARRWRGNGKWQQLHTRWVLDELLPPLKPNDALALIAFTAEDLFPAPDWNLVFGEASIEDRTGVWSLYRMGDPEKERELVLRRTLKIAAHETGHSFGLLHCAQALCLMNGANSLPEADRSPLEPCPSCLRKLQWAFGFPVRGRFERLKTLETEVGLTEEAETSAAALDALGR
jgi:archaemetzincin